MSKIIPILILVGLVLGGFWFFSKTKKTEVSQVGQTQSVPLPTQEDIIRTFFNLVNEEKIPEAVGMLSQKAASDDSVQQAWAAHLASFKSIRVEKIERSEGDTFRVDLQVEVSQEAANAPIPYYGWADGKNTRWIGLAKEGEVWKIDGLATGP